MRWIVLATALTWGCGSASDAVALERSGVVYGADDRLEYFETLDPELREIWASSMVALIEKTGLDPVASAVASTVPTVGTVYGLCEGEPFSLQPSAAFCSGTLVGRDLVLTAGHCAHALAVRDFAVVFGYYEVEANHLALGAGAIVDVLEVVSERLDRAGDVPRLDYAWLRLSHAPSPERRTVPIATVGTVAQGDSLIAVSSAAGSPLKADFGARVSDARGETRDYFVMDTDTSVGSSGGAAFDQSLALQGVFTRGATDFEPSEAGCNRTIRTSASSAPQEQFTYAFRALEGLCHDSPSEPICGARHEQEVAGGCALATSRSVRSAAPFWVGLALLVALARRNSLTRCRSCERSPQLVHCCKEV